MERQNPPKKILLIKNCTFILPDDFNGSLEDAFELFIKYRTENISKAKYIIKSPLFTPFDILLHLDNPNIRTCGDYAIYELIDGKYKIMNE